MNLENNLNGYYLTLKGAQYENCIELKNAFWIRYLGPRNSMNLNNSGFLLF